MDLKCNAVGQYMTCRLPTWPPRSGESVPPAVHNHDIRCDLPPDHDGPHAATLPHWDHVPPADRGKRVAWQDRGRLD